MKKLLFFLFSTQSLFAQVQTLPNSIGIGTGINSSIPLHINKNGEVARFQGTWPYVTLYDGTNINGYFQAINSTFEIGSKNSYDLNFFTGDAQRININGSTGKVTFNNGIQLLGGALQTAGSSGSDGMILVSKGSANPPTWENRKVGFQVMFASNFIIPSASHTTLSSFTEFFDYTNSFDNSVGVFTAPSNGLYAFHLNLNFGSGTPLSNVPGIIRLYKNGLLSEQLGASIDILNSYSNTIQATFHVELQTNDIVHFTFTQYSGGNLTLLGGFVQEKVITGYKIY